MRGRYSALTWHDKSLSVFYGNAAARTPPFLAWNFLLRLQQCHPILQRLSIPVLHCSSVYKINRQTTGQYQFSFAEYYDKETVRDASRVKIGLQNHTTLFLLIYPNLNINTIRPSRKHDVDLWFDFAVWNDKYNYQVLSLCYLLISNAN